jgi:SAM-dependent MidA family methyltransferase
MRFPEFMAASLYEPGLGYYARGASQIGRGGDFFTSVSVGPLFGELLARRFLREWIDLGAPKRWRIMEWGAHDGTLAADVLNSLSRLDRRSVEFLEYVIPEPLAALQSAQRETLHSFGKTVRLVSHTKELVSAPLPGIAFGNEVLDALPFHRVEWQAGRWLECRVGLGADGGFAWKHGEISDPLLLEALKSLGDAFSDGYRTEVRTCFRSFLEPIVGCLESGLMLWADYGFARPDYYHPDRRAGTLRTFSKHHADENPLANPGGADLTAHVDFTAVVEAAMALGGRATVFQNQGAWLTEVARDWLLEQEGRPHPSGMREFQTLTHPAHLGGSFHFLELSWNPSSPSQDPVCLAHRLQIAL